MNPLQVLPKGVVCQCFSRSGFEEYTITCTFDEYERIESKLLELLTFLSTNEIQAVYGFGFGNIRFSKVFQNSAKSLSIIIPQLTWVEGTISHDSIDGIFLNGIKGKDVEYIIENGDAIGCYYEDDYASYMHMGGLGLNHASVDGFEQTASLLSGIERNLKYKDMLMRNIVRTWFYNKEILSWYDAFNQARTKVYKQKQIFGNLIPASTGIDGKSPFVGMLTAGVFAVKPKDNAITIRKVDSPLQGAATDYGSSFSRAVEIITPGYHYLTISGTASIDEVGNTIFLDDLEKQLDQTFATIKEILGRVDMTFLHVNRAIAYVKHQAHVVLFRQYIKDKKLDFLPLIIVNTTICRDNLLFELEVDAVRFPSV